MRKKPSPLPMLLLDHEEGAPPTLQVAKSLLASTRQPPKWATQRSPGSHVTAREPKTPGQRGPRRPSTRRRAGLRRMREQEEENVTAHVGDASLDSCSPCHPG
ncbi:hypothetical protein HGRIS_006778 [Hohenbuehelia grisea]|uniref:Uncharacterized protein n=1 Tax=Hohenbuehelia grisea TaxID=104357 RepID=A0ABR3JAK1_9AGAR